MSSKLNAFFHMLFWSWYFVKAIEILTKTSQYQKWGVAVTEMTMFLGDCGKALQLCLGLYNHNHCSTVAKRQCDQSNF